MPPNYHSDKANRVIEHVYGIVIDLKRRYKDPYLAITGDFNQWPIERALGEFREISEVDVGPTRVLCSA